MSNIRVDKNDRNKAFRASQADFRHDARLHLKRRPDPRLTPVAWSPPLFIVGCPRSGTTLVQTMLDSHPRLSVTYEADFLVDVTLGLRSSAASAEQALTAAEAHSNFRTNNYDISAARTVCRELGITDAAGAMRVLAASEAVARGKARWGNKTPKALLHLAGLAAVYPDAQFIHVIRDGRHAALSQLRVSNRSLVQGALLWRTGLRTGRPAGSRLGPDRYLEVRLEELAAAPEEQLRRMCAFLGEEFAPSMLQSHKAARDRIPASDLGIHPRLGEPARAASAAPENTAPGLVERAAAALIEKELVELGYVPAASGRSRRMFHVIVGYTLFLVSLRRSVPELTRHLARSGGARRAARSATRQYSARHALKGIPAQQASPYESMEAAGKP